MRASIPTRRRVAVVSSTRLSDRSFLRTSARAAASSSAGSTSSSDLAGDLVVDALAAQLLGQRPPGQTLARLAGLHPGPGERLVVDQPDLLEPVEEPGGDVARAPLLGQLVAELLAAAGLAGQLVEQDLAGHRLRVGLGHLGRRVLGAVVSRLASLAPQPPGRGARRVHASTPAETSPSQSGARPVLVKRHVTPLGGVVSRLASLAPQPPTSVVEVRGAPATSLETLD